MLESMEDVRFQKFFCQQTGQKHLKKQPSSLQHLRAFMAQVGFFYDLTHIFGISVYSKFLEDVVDFFICAHFDGLP